MADLSGVARRGLLPMALVVLGVAVGALAVTGTNAPEPVGPTAEHPLGRLYLVPTGLDPGLRPAFVSTDQATRATVAPGHLRLFAPVTPGRLTMERALAVVVGDGPLRARATSEIGTGGLRRESLESLMVGGEPTTVYREGASRSSVSWRQADGRAVAVIADGLDDADLVAAAGSLRPLDAATARPILPAGFAPVHEDRWPAENGSTRELRADWRDLRLGRTFTLMVKDGPEQSLALAAWELAGRPIPATTVDVRGTRGLASGIGVLPSLTWIERPGTVVSIAGNGIDAAGLHRIAEGLRTVDEAAWRDLMPAPADPVLSPVALASGQHGGGSWEATARLVPSTGLGIPASACLVVPGVTPPCPSVGSSPPPGTVFHSLDVRPSSDGRAVFVTAALDRDVARVEVELDGGAVVGAIPVGGGANLPVTFVVVPLEGGAKPTVVTAFDAGGRELGRREV